MATPAQNRFLADLQKATAGITYTPQGISQLQSLALNRPGGASARDLINIANAPRAKPVLEDIGSTGPQVDDQPKPPSNAGVTGGDPYPAVLPPLTPEMQRALLERRRAATSAFEQIDEDARLRAAEAEASNVAALNQLMEQAGREQRLGMEQLASRGVARSPLFVNRLAREQARLTQERAAELDVQLGATLAEINTELRNAQQALEREYADIDFETAVQRSAVNRLLGIA